MSGDNFLQILYTPFFLWYPVLHKKELTQRVFFALR